MRESASWAVAGNNGLHRNARHSLRPIFDDASVSGYSGNMMDRTAYVLRQPKHQPRPIQWPLIA